MVMACCCKSHSLDALGFGDTPTTDWPRVWWVCSGLFNILPLYATGYHDPPTSRAGINRVISSYVPTIKSLQYARSILASQSATNATKALLVGMVKTPDETDLP